MSVSGFAMALAGAINVLIPIMESVGSALGYTSYQKRIDEFTRYKNELQRGIGDLNKIYSRLQSEYNALSNMKYLIDPRNIKKIDDAMAYVSIKAEKTMRSINDKSNQIETAATQLGNQQFGIAGVVDFVKNAISDSNKNIKKIDASPKNDQRDEKGYYSKDALITTPNIEQSAANIGAKKPKFN